MSEYSSTSTPPAKIAIPINPSLPQVVDSTRTKTEVWSGIRVFVRLLPMIGLLWIFFGLRIYHIEGWLPDFIDEILHVDRARIVWKFTDLQTSTTPSKFLLYYYLALFDLQPHDPLFVARSAVAIISMLGAVGTFALARTLFSRTAGLYALIIVAFFPLLLFHEKMALTDPLAAIFVVLVAWSSVLLAKRPTYRRAMLVGVSLNLMLAAKLLTGTILALPIAAILFFSPQPFQIDRSWVKQGFAFWKTYRPYLLRVGIVVGFVWAIIMGFYVGRGLTNPDATGPIIDDYLYAGVAGDLGNDNFYISTTDVIELNLRQINEIFRYFWGYILVIVLVITLPLLLWRYPYATLFLVGGVLLVWVPVSIIAAKPNSRYFSLVVHLAIVLTAGGLAAAQTELSRRVKPLTLLPSIVLGLWVITFGFPFFSQMIDDAAQLELPYYEIRGYYRNLSGYAINDALEETSTLPHISRNSDKPVIYGSIRACRFMGYRVSAATFEKIVLLCHDESGLLANQYLNESLATYGSIYLLQEDIPKYQPDRHSVNGRLQFIKSYLRPHDGVMVSLYVVYPEIRIGGYQPSPD